MTQQTCPHMFERIIQHQPTGDLYPHMIHGVLQLEQNYRAGDVMLLVCPRGCPDIEVTIGIDKLPQEEGL